MVDERVTGSKARPMGVKPLWSDERALKTCHQNAFLKLKNVHQVVPDYKYIPLDLKTWPWKLFYVSNHIWTLHRTDALDYKCLN